MDKVSEAPKDARRAFYRHRANAESQGKVFRLTLAEWWSLWAPHWPERRKRKYCMCRTGDIGAYEIGNVRIDTQRGNSRERVFYGIPRRRRRYGARKLKVEPFAVSLAEALDAVKVDYLRRAILRCRGNNTAAAKMMGLNARQFYYLKRKYGISWETEHWLAL